MQILGKTVDGQMTIVALHNDEIATFREARARLAVIRGIVSGAEVSELDHAPFCGRDEGGKALVKVKRSTRKLLGRPPKSKPAATPISKTDRRPCFRCNKVQVEGRTRYCEECKKARGREYAAEHYRKTHPGSTSRPIIGKAPSSSTLTKADRVALIASAAKRVDQAREQEDKE